ncbi:MAG: hypothetical protein ACP5N2_03750 [Candidatus Nanoarchaeia archaeon]
MVRERTVIINRSNPADVLQKVKEGKKFVVVDDSFTVSMIPLGYMLIDMKYKATNFKTLVPQSLLFYLANPGEGGVDDALDEIRDFYSEIEDYEDKSLEKNDSSVQGTNWAVTARNAYQTYVINKLTSAKDGNEDNPDWNSETLKDLDLADDFVERRVKAIAALSLGKSKEQDLKKYNLGDVLRHVTINERKVEQITREEFDQITCWAGSHYDLKDEYKNSPEVSYNIDRMHDQNHKVGEKVTYNRDQLVLDKRIDELEQEIADYRQAKNPEKITTHDRMLLRMYTNVAYIAKEDKTKQLEIKPDTAEALASATQNPELVAQNIEGGEQK